jgi:hypothetical protein
MAEASNATSTGYYLMPRWKLLLLSFLALNIFLVYWLFKTWKHLKDNSNDTFSPSLRAIFSIFFVHDLFRRIRDDATNRSTAVATFNVSRLAWLFVVLSLLQPLPLILSRISFGHFLISSVGTFELLLLLPLVGLTWIGPALACLPIQSYLNTVAIQAGIPLGRWTVIEAAFLIFGLLRFLRIL